MFREGAFEVYATAYVDDQSRNDYVSTGSSLITHLFSITPLLNKKIYFFTMRREAKLQFYLHITDLFQNGMPQAFRLTATILGNVVTENIRRGTAVDWMFTQLDVNKDEVLERNEWKTYKKDIIQWKKVKHCSRNLFKTCDTDMDNRLTIKEWKKCLNPVITKTSTLRPDQLNPFLYILKAD
ncbi:EF hand [Dictyocaulus viviparus]|uniref:EF hand n=1 Tax=Dictyocaulus viviparus TaxID=29172 RepID=A0A0D8Y9L1_DICVI|nr:EF hand [Dictyocaulus viviparus]